MKETSGSVPIMVGTRNVIGEANWLDSERNIYARMYHPVADSQRVMVEADSGLFPVNTECLKVEYIELKVRLSGRRRLRGGNAGHAWVWRQVSRCQARPLVA